MLAKSIRAAFKGYIDFNDQVYMPALFGGAFQKFPVILVDEYQDLSPVDHKLLERITSGRLIGVGDRYQNIYGFRGAKAGGMLEAVEAYSMNIMPLSLTFRCPTEIVKHPDEQNQNLDYVISTRSSSTLIEIDTDRITWE